MGLRLARGERFLDIGLSSYSLRCAGGLWGYAPQGIEPLSPEGYLRVAKGLDFDGIHFVDLRHFESTARGYLATIASLADDLDLYIEVGVVGTDRGLLVRALEVGERLACRVVSVAVGGSRLSDPAAWEQRLTAAETDLLEIVPVLEETEVRLALRSAGDLTAQEILRLVECARSELVGACVDPVQSLLVLEPPSELAAQLAPRAHSLELGDVTVESRPDGCLVSRVSLGAGIIDSDSLVSLVAKRDRGVRLNIDTPVELLRIPYLTPGWRGAFGEEAVERFDAWVRSVPPPSEESRQPADASIDPLDAEMGQARASVHFARERKWHGL
jgi:sugar phosphate isomerase/epimerase